MTFADRPKVIVPKNLLDFLIEWQQWAENGAPVDEIFDRGLGLCSLYATWSIVRDKTIGSFSLSQALRASDLGTTYPFGGDSRYDKDMWDETMHLNKERLGWVQRIIEDNT